MGTATKGVGTGGPKPSGTEPSGSAEPAPPGQLARGTQDDVAPPRIREGDVARLVRDLQSPLATIALETLRIDDHVHQGARGDALAVARRIRDTALHLDRMVHDLLDACAISTGKLVLRRAPTELRTLLEGVIERVVPSSDRHRVFLEAPRPLVMCIDDLRIERVVGNLLEHAFSHAPASSGVVVRLAAEEDLGTVSVIDAGGGLAPAELCALFERGGDGSGAGGGLGLYVSRKIVEAHGGRIGVDTSRGVGSRLFFELRL